MKYGRIECKEKSLVSRKMLMSENVENKNTSTMAADGTKMKKHGLLINGDATEI